jgi:hypothetical protein
MHARRNLRIADEETMCVKLALFGDVAGVSDIMARLKTQWGPVHAETYRTLNQGAHEGHSGDLASLIDDTKAHVSKIAGKLT